MNERQAPLELKDHEDVNEFGFPRYVHEMYEDGRLLIRDVDQIINSAGVFDLVKSPAAGLLAADWAFDIHCAETEVQPEEGIPVRVATYSLVHRYGPQRGRRKRILGKQTFRGGVLSKEETYGEGGILRKVCIYLRHNPTAMRCVEYDENRKKTSRTMVRYGVDGSREEITTRLDENERPTGPPEVRRFDPDGEEITGGDGNG